jgi:magnesium transporter
MERPDQLARPGAFAGDAERLMLRALTLADQGWVEVDDLARISDLLQESGALVWARADVADLDEKAVATISEEFGLHPLAVEDALSERQRPKLEVYDTHLFTVMHQLDTINEQLEATQISCFVGQRYVLTLHHEADRTIDEATKRCQRAAKPEDRGPSFVMHALLDTIIDDYQAIADQIEHEIEQVEDRVLHDFRAPVQGELYSIKQRLSRLRRYAVPGERVLATVVEPGRFQLITGRTAEYFRDVHDHTLRIIDQIRNVQDLTDAVFDLQRAEQANEMNDVTKKLTGWAAIVAVPTFIASVYGMNFDLIPNEGDIFGFFFALALMTGSGVGLYGFFKRRRWI